MCHDNGIFSTREEEYRTIELGSSLSQYEDRLGFQLLDMVELVGQHVDNVGGSCYLISGRTIL